MANYYVTTTGAGTKSGADWANAFDWAEFVTHSTGSAVAGDIYWIAEGTYTLSGLYSNSKAGTAQKSIRLIGVASSTTNEPPIDSDHATGTNRPLIECGTNYFSVGHYWFLKNLRMTGSHTSYTFNCGQLSVCINCFIENTSASGKSLNIYSGIVFDCEVIGSGSRIIEPNMWRNTVIKNSYIHGTALVGIYLNNYYAGYHSVVGSIISGPATGIDLVGAEGVKIYDNTIYGCSTRGIDLETSANNFILNNTINNCGIGIYGDSTTYPQSFIDYNNYYNNTTDITGLTKGPNALTVDPGFTDAANGNFSLLSNSGLIGTGFGIRLGVS